MTSVHRERPEDDDRDRLLWDLQTINEIADGIARSLELDDVLVGALQRVVRALDCVGGSIRLKDELTGGFEVRAALGTDHLRGIWADAGGAVTRPSEHVIATGRALVVDDIATWMNTTPDLPIRSALCVPLVAGTELLGTLSVLHARPARFCSADQRLLVTIAGQIAVATERARLHGSVRRAKREWEQTFDAIGEPIAVFDVEGRLIRGNAALAALLGRPVTTLRSIVCCAIGFCGSSDCAVRRALTNVASRSEVTRADGQIFSVRTFPVAGSSDGAAVVQVAKNVTEEIRTARRMQQMSDEVAAANARSMAALVQLKSTQAQLLQAEKLSAIGQLVAGVAHELNNPLTSVIGYAQLLEEEFTSAESAESIRDADQLARDVRRIAEESERAARIVRNLLSFARRQTATRSAHNVVELLDRVLALRSYEFRMNGIVLETAFPERLPSVVVDPSQLQQALLNLVLNAEQAMRGRSHRRLSVGARYDEPAGAVELFISDTGHGIEPANLSRIFDPFFTTRDVGEGTGLGLSICYGIVRDHGGQIAVDSQVDGGTTFSLLLPASQPGAAGKMLVAHVDRGERDLLAAALGAWGYTAVVEESPAAAVVRYRAGDLQAVFVDRGSLSANLAEWRAARALDSRVPLVFLSMADQDDEVERFARQEAQETLAPPFQLRALRSAVRAVSKECV